MQGVRQCQVQPAQQGGAGCGRAMDADVSATHGFDQYQAVIRYRIAFAAAQHAILELGVGRDPRRAGQAFDDLGVRFFQAQRPFAA